VDPVLTEVPELTAELAGIARHTSSASLLCGAPPRADGGTTGEGRRRDRLPAFWADRKCEDGAAGEPGMLLVVSLRS
jgi:hypothetical protein